MLCELINILNGLIGCVLVNTEKAYSIKRLCIQILLISSFLLIPVVKDFSEISKISRTAEPSGG